MNIKDFYTGLYQNTENKNFNLVHWQLFTKKDIEKENLNGLSVLEIGVGPNGLIFTLKNKYKNNIYYGIDLSEAVLSKMKKNDIHGIKLNLGEEKIPLEDNFFDIIIFNEVIEHIFDCQNVLDEIYRILKKGGKFFITTHNTFNIFMRLRFLLGFFPSPNLDVSEPCMGEHIRMFNNKLLKKLLLRAGFKDKNLVNKSYFVLGKLSFYTRFLTSLLSRHLYFICKK